MIYCNTTSKHKTHFLAGVELVKRATEQFNLCSENWPYPSGLRFGDPTDKYYAEIWVNGMDWQRNHWVIETVSFGEPRIGPLIVFDDHSEEHMFNQHDFEELINALLWCRREKFFDNDPDMGRFNDTIFPFLWYHTDPVTKHRIWKEGCQLFLSKYSFQHASQPKVTFWLNPEYTYGG